jgi:hypothetical protein
MNANITAIVFCPLLQQSVDGCELHAAACAVLRLLPVMPWLPLAGADAKLIHAFTDGSFKVEEDGTVALGWCCVVIAEMRSEMRSGVVCRRKCTRCRTLGRQRPRVQQCRRGSRDCLDPCLGIEFVCGASSSTPLRSNKKRRSEPALASMMSLSSGATTIAMNEKPKKTQKMT